MWKQLELCWLMSKADKICEETKDSAFKERGRDTEEEKKCLCDISRSCEGELLFVLTMLNIELI